MANAQVITGEIIEETTEVSLAADNQNFTSEDKSNLNNFSFESSPLLDKEKIKRCSARSTDEFWDALSSNYDYLMDDGLIATCREASSDLSLDDENELPESCHWSFSQFIEQFKWLHDLLHNLQVAKEGENNRSDSKIVDEQQKIVYLCKLFNDQAQTLSKRYPDMRDEVHRHLNRLNNKWKAVEQSINPNKVKSPSKDCVFNEITNRMRSLRKWLRDIEQRLIPVNLATNWNLESLDKRYKEQMELQKEIESQGKYVSTLRKLCEHLKGNVRFGQNSLMVWDAERVRKVACNLEHRWHALWLKSLECHCILEDLIQNCAKHSDKLDKSFTDEPLKKYPRLSGACEELLLLENELREKMSSKVDEDVTVDESLFCNNHIQQTDLTIHRDGYTLKNDKGIMVGDTGIAELKAECQSGNGKFEIIQDVGYSSETSAHFSNDEKIDSPETHCLKNIKNGTYVPATSNCNVSHVESTPKVILAPDKYPSVALKTLHFLSEDKPLFNSKFGSCRTVPDSFYKMASVDDEIFEDNGDVSTKIDVPSELLCKKILNISQSVNSKVEVSNENFHLNLNSNAQSHDEKIIAFKEDSVTKQTVPSDYNLSPNSTLKRNKKSIKSSINMPAKPVESDQQWKKNAKVHEWLNTCQSADDGTSDDNLEVSEKSSKTEWSHKTADSSCDASGEYTTTESDSERSNVSDVNNSITFSQSFTGSIETVIPAVPEESCVVQSDRAGSTEPSPGVRMRKKKRVPRDRPWSVTDVNQTFVSPSFPHSTSESALDLLYSAQDSKKIGSKNLGSENKRFSLTDISTLSGSSIKSLKINLKGLKSSVLDKNASRRKKGSDQSDSFPCQFPERESTPKHIAASLNPVSSIIEDKGEKASVHEVSSLETSIVSENERSESVINLEDHGSISWDEYQDPPYLSEPYSEQTADEDEVKKLINFGDDYRAMLGSYSDNSSISLKAPPSKIHRTRSKSSWHKGSSQESRDSLMSDSNSDSEDFHHIMKTSNRTLLVVSNTLKENMQKMTSFSKEFAELVATCQTNLCNLHAIHTQLVSGCELEALSKEDILKLQDLIKDWEALQVKLLTLSQNDNEKSKNAELEAAVIDVHCSLAALKEKLTVMAASATDAGEAVESLSQLKKNIQNLQAGLSNVQEMKDSVLSVTARILRIMAEGGGPAITPLRDNATKLYQQWEDVYELNCSQLTKLQGLQQRWHESTESEMNSSSETTVQWHPVQVGDTLPTPQVSTEGFYQSTAAEVQVADQNDVLFEIETESAKAIIQCYIENENDDLRDPIHLLSPPAVKTGILRDLPEEKGSAEISSTRKLSCFWRTLRATVPIQFALVILYCMSSLMEPQCCDNMNNYDFSLFPHLRYLRGPPPV